MNIKNLWNNIKQNWTDILRGLCKNLQKPEVTIRLRRVFKNNFLYLLQGPVIFIHQKILSESDLKSLETEFLFDFWSEKDLFLKHCLCTASLFCLIFFLSSGSRRWILLSANQPRLLMPNCCAKHLGLWCYINKTLNTNEIKTSLLRFALGL